MQAEHSYCRFNSVIIDYNQKILRTYHVVNCRRTIFDTMNSINIDGKSYNLLIISI